MEVVAGDDVTGFEGGTGVLASGTGGASGFDEAGSGGATGFAGSFLPLSHSCSVSTTFRGRANWSREALTTSLRKRYHLA